MSKDTRPTPDSPEFDYPPFRAIAKEVGCKVEDVFFAFEKVAPPEMYTSGLLRNFDDEVQRLEDAEKHLKKLIKALNGLSDQHVVALEEASSIHLVDLPRLLYQIRDCRGEVEKLKFSRSRKGGSEPAADLVCQGLDNLFLNLGKRVTFGHDESAPSTDFGRAVRTGFNAFSLKSDWRAYASKWRRKLKSV